MKVQWITSRGICRMLAGGCVIASLLLALFHATPLRADIYKKRLPDGTLCFTNIPTDGGWDIYFRERKGNNYRFPRRPNASEIFRRSYYDTIIRQIAQNHGVDPDLVKGIIHVESAYNPLALSPKGAMGLMQLMPETASLLGVRDPWDPHENITGGTKFVSYLLKKYHGNLTLTLAAYNAGPGAVDSYGGIPPYQETQDYVRSVLAIYNGGRR